MGRNYVDYTLKKKYMNFALKWCRDHFGENDRKRTKLIIDLSKKNKKHKNDIFYGHYCFYRNKITLYENSCKTVYDIVSTVIHEYTHYLQSRTKYLSYQDAYYYSTNPYEREAKRNEDRYTKTCIKDIRKLIY
jgi:Zn-dependent peptidase ImmA (M78 family)